MNSVPTIQSLPEKKLVGKKLTMSYVANQTGALWQSFMPVRKQITNNLSESLYSMQVYGVDYSFNNFNPHTTFEKWAAIEVSDFNAIPADMFSYTLPSGMYAVFPYKGPASGGAQMFQYIFGVWLPASEYQVDNRPHFELLGEKYKNDHPESEEEFWIPVRKKL